MEPNWPFKTTNPLQLCFGFFIGVWSGIFLAPTPTMAELNEVTKLVERKDCAQHLSESNGIFHQFLRVWFLDTQSPTNVNEYFKHLVLKHEEHFKWLLALQKSRQKLPPIADIPLALNKLDQAQEDIISPMSIMFEQEDVFMMSLSSLEQAFSELKKPFEQTNAVCKENAKDVLIRSNQVITQLTDSLAKMRLYIAESRKKRLALLSAIHQVYRSRLIAAQKQDIANRIDALKDGIDAALMGDQLLIKVGAWRRKSTVPGFARGHIIKLNYTKSMRYLHADHQEGLELRAALLRIPKLNERARGIISYEIESNLSLIEKQIKKLEEGGWKKLWNRQKEDVAELRGFVSATNDKDCSSAINVFESLEKSCESLAEFQVIEPVYEQVRISCKLGAL